MGPSIQISGFQRGYCTETINSLGGVTVTMPNEILVSLTGPGRVTPPKKYSLMLLNILGGKIHQKSPKIRLFLNFVWPLEDA